MISFSLLSWQSKTDLLYVIWSGGHGFRLSIHVIPWYLIRVFQLINAPCFAINVLVNKASPLFKIIIDLPIRDLVDTHTICPQARICRLSLGWGWGEQTKEKINNDNKTETCLFQKRLRIKVHLNGTSLWDLTVVRG